MAKTRPQSAQRENRQLRLEREIFSKAAAWFARETNTIPPKVPVREPEPDPIPDRHHMSAPGCLRQRLLCVGEAAAVAVCRHGRSADRGDPPPRTRPRAVPTARRAFMPSLRQTAFALVASGLRG